MTNELRGERIDVVPFADDPVEFIQAALQPARVREVRLDDDTGIATVVVSDYQLSLAIGKEGQNARLAARLTGWRIDIKSETQLAEEEAGYGEEWAEGEWVENEAGRDGVAAGRGWRGGLGRGVVARRLGRGRRRSQARRGAVGRRPTPRAVAEPAEPPAPDGGTGRRRRSADEHEPERRSTSRRAGRAGEHAHSPPPHVRRLPAERGAGRAGPGVGAAPTASSPSVRARAAGRGCAGTRRRASTRRCAARRSAGRCVAEVVPEAVERAP